MRIHIASACWDHRSVRCRTQQTSCQDGDAEPPRLAATPCRDGLAPGQGAGRRRGPRQPAHCRHRAARLASRVRHVAPSESAPRRRCRRLAGRVRACKPGPFARRRTVRRDCSSSALSPPRGMRNLGAARRFLMSAHGARRLTHPAGLSASHRCGSEGFRSEPEGTPNAGRVQAVVQSARLGRSLAMPHVQLRARTTPCMTESFSGRQSAPGHLGPAPCPGQGLRPARRVPHEPPGSRAVAAPGTSAPRQPASD